MNDSWVRQFLKKPDKNVTNQVTKLKKDLLQIVNVREFSNEAEFVDPSLSFIIPQV